MALDPVPEGIRLVSGRTATVAIESDGQAPRFDLFGARRAAPAAGC